MQGPRPTIRDVAGHAAVSKATVSHVLNGTRHVSEETKSSVLKAMDELGYVPSSIARSLTTRRTATVGVLIDDAANHHFSQILRGVEDILMPASYGLFVCSTDGVPEREAHYLDRLLRHRVDGIISGATTRDWPALAGARAHHTPVVFVGETIEGMQGPFVDVSNEESSYQAVSHLIDCGHRRIGILAGPQIISPMRERQAGFRRALQDRGIPWLKEWVAECEEKVQAACQATHQILSSREPPTALFLSSNMLSLGALLAVTHLGLRCPQDVALIGFDDHPWADVSDPPLTVVRQPTREIGQVAARMLYALMNGDSPPETRVILEGELVFRRSCCMAHAQLPSAIPTPAR